MNLAPIPSENHFSLIPLADRDILAELLADKRSENTRKAYARDLKYFFVEVCGAEPSPQLVTEFLQLERFTAIALVLKYKARLIERKLAEATINRRLAAIKSLVSYSQKIGRCLWSLEEVEGERVQSYRDTSGIDRESFRRILAVPNRDSTKGARDYAILRLLWENALRRNELISANISDFNPGEKTLAILGKGRGSQKETISLSAGAVEAIGAWLALRPELAPDAPLFIALDNANSGHRLTGDGLYKLIRNSAKQAGISKVMSPHRCRHSSITAALDMTGGDVRRVQKLSRHKKVETVLRYDDNRVNAQGQLTDLLGSALD